MGSSSHYHRFLEGYIVCFILEGTVGRDIPLNTSFEVQELTEARGVGGSSSGVRGSDKQRVANCGCEWESEK